MTKIFVLKNYLHTKTKIEALLYNMHKNGRF